ncbi:MAG TPA: PDZ domain-containing protein, partial [Pyrinomonadaceae bacterium]|nr:PDZ domain-containing protein [Pyrinomonadaceae bacterium]
MLRLTTIAVVTLSFAVLSVAQTSKDRKPVRVVGEFNYQSTVVAKYFTGGATAELICVSRSLRADNNEYVPKAEQILGRFTTPIYPPPLKFEIPLPVEPQCADIDLDNNGRKNVGVKVFAAITAINLFGDSYLEQLEQESGFTSVVADSNSASIRTGTLLVFAPDANQRISSGFGSDGKLFTEDDPTVPVAAGYTLMKISGGKVEFERGTELRMDIAQPGESKSPDFSSQGFVESFNSLIDLLKERYAYTELRKIDWEQKRSEYLPRIRAAEAKQDLQDYYLAIYDFASGMNDGHVQTGTYDPKIAGKRQEMIRKRLSGNLGAQLIRYSDGRFIVFAVGEDSAAEKAGLVVGSEILKINGRDVLTYLRSLPKIGFVGTEERAIADAVRQAFFFPIGESVTLEFRRPGETSGVSAVLVSGDFQTGNPFPELRDSNPISMKVVGERRYGYVRWNDFENTQMNIAGFETFLGRSNTAPGIIIDLRGNG